MSFRKDIMEVTTMIKQLEKENDLLLLELVGAEELFLEEMKNNKGDINYENK